MKNLSQTNKFKVLDVRAVTSFADYFVICSGSNSRQIQAIGDAVAVGLKEFGERPISVEGFQAAEWILADYGDLLIHVFSDKARQFYDLERLWKHAKTVPVPPSAGSPEQTS
ncbi:MAG: ribosome silencing factor [Acidobacteria bacterium]|nr:ribosome silencing factor [Acidobacteriota bacterium]